MLFPQRPNFSPHSTRRLNPMTNCRWKQRLGLAQKRTVIAANPNACALTRKQTRAAEIQTASDLQTEMAMKCLQRPPSRRKKLPQLLSVQMWTRKYRVKQVVKLSHKETQPLNQQLLGQKRLRNVQNQNEGAIDGAEGQRMLETQTLPRDWKRKGQRIPHGKRTLVSKVASRRISVIPVHLRRKVPQRIRRKRLQTKAQGKGRMRNADLQRLMATSKIPQTMMMLRREGQVSYARPKRSLSTRKPLDKYVFKRSRWESRQVATKGKGNIHKTPIGEMTIWRQNLWRDPRRLRGKAKVVKESPVKAKVVKESPVVLNEVPYHFLKGVKPLHHQMLGVRRNQRESAGAQGRKVPIPPRELPTKVAEEGTLTGEGEGMDLRTKAVRSAIPDNWGTARHRNVPQKTSGSPGWPLQFTEIVMRHEVAATVCSVTTSQCK